MVPLLRRVAQVIAATLTIVSAVLTFYQDKWPKVALASALALIILLVWELVERELREKPKLAIKHEPDAQTYWMAGAHLHRIGVENAGGKQAEDVQVWLRRIDPDPGLRVDVIPSKLGHKGGNCSSGGNICVISPHDEHHFDVIQCVGANGSGFALWGLVTVECTFQPVPLEFHREYRFYLRARANDAQNEDRILLVRNNADGTLSVNLWEQRVPNWRQRARPVIDAIRLRISSGWRKRPLS